MAKLRAWQRALVGLRAQGTGTEIFARLMLMSSQNPERLTWLLEGLI